MPDPSAKSGPKTGSVRFAKGRSGNPHGRPQGSRNKATVMLEKILADDAEEVVKAILKAAKNGDMAAARMVVDRIIPFRKGRAVPFQLPNTSSAEGILEAFGTLVEAVGKGEMTPEEAASISGVLESKRKALETAEFDRRLAAVERKIGSRE